MKSNSVIVIACLFKLIASLATPLHQSMIGDSLQDYDFNVTRAGNTRFDDATATAAGDSNKLWANSVSRGSKLLAAMKGSDADAATLFGMGETAQSPFDGDLREKLKEWGWNDNTEKMQKKHDSKCNFKDNHKIGRCFAELGLQTESKGNGGPNECFTAEHFDGPAVKKKLGVLRPKPKDQVYEVCGTKYRVTEAHYQIGVNSVGGAVMMIDARSPASGAAALWGRPPLAAELPHIRSTSDIAWAFWNRAAAANIKNIRYFFVCLIVNPDTVDIIRMAHEKLTPPRSAPGTWPGTEFTMDSEQGLALLGSPLGRWAGYFLMQHKIQLGGNKYISKVRIFKNDSFTMPYMVFYVQGPAIMSATGESDDEKLRVVKRSADGKNVLREHFIRARL